jgi:hypothetical protein
METTMKKFLIPLAALGLLASTPVFAAEGGAQGSAGPQHGATLAAEGGSIMRHDQQQTLAFVDPAAPRLILAEAEGGSELNSHANGRPQQQA